MVKINKIYTRTGDDGSTGLVDGSRASKSDVRINAIGDVDEANSCIGFVIPTLADGEVEAGIATDLLRIQNDLFDLGADIATPGSDFTPSEMVLRIVNAQVDWLEQRIDAANAGLTPLTSFILPGGSEAAARLHIARAVVRRAERSLVAASGEYAINPAAVRYLNRLSDYLFTLCRVANGGQGGDILWVPGGAR